MTLARTYLRTVGGHWYAIVGYLALTVVLISIVGSVIGANSEVGSFVWGLRQGVILTICAVQWMSLEQRRSGTWHPLEQTWLQAGVTRQEIAHHRLVLTLTYGLVATLLSLLTGAITRHASGGGTFDATLLAFPMVIIIALLATALPHGSALYRVGCWVTIFGGMVGIGATSYFLAYTLALAIALTLSVVMAVVAWVLLPRLVQRAEFA